MIRGLAAVSCACTLALCLPAWAAEESTTAGERAGQLPEAWANVFPLSSDSFGGHTLDMDGNPHEAQTLRQQQAEAEAEPPVPSTAEQLSQSLPLPADSYGGQTLDMLGNPHDEPTIVQANREADAEAQQMATTPRER